MNAVTKSRNSFGRAIPPASEEEFINMARRSEPVQVLQPVEEPTAGEGGQPAEAAAAIEATQRAKRPNRQVAAPGCAGQPLGRAR